MTEERKVNPGLLKLVERVKGIFPNASVEYDAWVNLKNNTPCTDAKFIDFIDIKFPDATFYVIECMFSPDLVEYERYGFTDITDDPGTAAPDARWFETEDELLALLTAKKEGTDGNGS